MQFGVNFWKAMYQERAERRKRERATRARAGLPRVDRDAPYDLKIGSIVTLKSLFAYGIPPASLLDADSFEPFLTGAVVDRYSRMEFGSDVLHRWYFSEGDQEYLLQVATDQKGTAQQGQSFLFLLQRVFIPKEMAHVDYYVKDGEGIIGDPSIGLQVDGMDDPIEYFTEWGDEGGWVEPVEGSELVYDDPVDDPVLRMVHQMGLFQRPIVEGGQSKEVSLWSLAKFYDNWRAREDNYDRRVLMVYVGLPLKESNFTVLNRS